MKKTKIFRLTLILLTITFFTSCSKDDSHKIETAKVTYADTNLSATFFNEGSSLAPSIDWGGEQGNFSLGTPLEGLSINTTTGVLSWTKELPIGEHTLQTIATNSAGQIVINLTLNNSFQGVFSGRIDEIGDNNILEFNSDFSLQIKYDNSSNQTGSGVWSRNGGTIETECTVDNESTEFILLGTLNVGTTAIYSGRLIYSGLDFGGFELTLQ